MKVTLFGLETEVEFNESDIFENDEYEENVLVDGLWIANDDAVGAWIQVGTEEQYWQEHATHFQCN